MPRDTKKTIKRLAAQLFVFPIEEYLSSERFLIFCRDNDLGDVWREKLEFSRDTPDLYGSAVIQNALVLFLHHIFQSRQGEFPELFTRFLRGFSQEISQTLPVDDLKKDFVYLGYPDNEIDIEFSTLKANADDH